MSSRHLTAVHPTLFAAYAVLFLYAENVRDTVPGDVLRALVIAVIGAALALAVASVALRDPARGALAASAFVAVFFFLYPPVAAFVHRADRFVPTDRLDVFYGPILGLMFALAGAGAVAGAVVVTERASRHLPAINNGLTAMAVVLLAFPLLTIGASVPGAAPIVGGPSGLVAQRTTTRDIYYLVLDQYGTNRALESAFGVTGNDLPAWLEQHGFHVASRARANYYRTTQAMPATLNLDYLDAVVGAMGPKSTDYRPLYEMIQDHRVGRFLREQGYQYVHVGNWFGPISPVRIADRNMEAGGLTDFEAQLQDQTALRAIAGLVVMGEPAPAKEQIHVDSARFQFAALTDLADDADEPVPLFVMAHVLLPHAPYVFDADGSYLPISERRQLTHDQIVAAQLAHTNIETKKLIERLLARPAADQPIIVVQADEGPYPPRYAANYETFDWSTATQEEVETKFGILDALYLPTDPDQPVEAPEPYPTISSVNTFRLVFNRYFGVDLPFLPDRAFAATSPDTPYDLIELTDRLAGP